MKKTQINYSLVSLDGKSLERVLSVSNLLRQDFFVLWTERGEESRRGESITDTETRINKTRRGEK